MPSLIIVGYVWQISEKEILPPPPPPPFPRSTVSSPEKVHPK